MDNSKNRTVAAGSLLVNPGKSSRLQAMRNKAMAANQSAPTDGRPQSKAASHDKTLSPELLLARSAIDRRLAEILASLPAGKQQSLFRIRFGIELEQLKNLPIKRVVGMLKIGHPQLKNPQGDMKRIVDLTYNGEQPIIPAP